MVLSENKIEYKNPFMAYAPEVLKTMSPEEQLKLDLEYCLYGATSGTVNIPYIATSGNMCRGGQATGLYRNFDVTQPVEQIQKKIYPVLDTYISVNVYGKDAVKNNAESIEQIRGIYIDLDVLHDAGKRIEKLEEEGKLEEAVALRCKLDRREEYLNLLFGTLQELIFNRILPEPSKFVFTGRGYALYFKYKEPIIANEESKTLHRALYLAVFERFEAILYHLPELADMDLEVDRHVYNVDRVARLAGTMNTKAKKYCRILSFGPWYSVEELEEAFGFDKELFAENIQKTEKKAAGKKQKVSAAVGTGKSRRAAGSSNIREYRPDNNIIPFVKKIDRDTAKFNLQCLDKLFSKCVWVEGAHRERFIFVYYNAAKILFGAAEAYRRVIELNNDMTEPLQLAEINYAIQHTDTHREVVGSHSDGFFTFKPETIISADWLDISAEVAEECGFFDTAKKKATYAANNAKAAERDILISGMYLQDGFGLEKIQKALPEHLQCSKNTVKRTLIRLGIYGEKGNPAISVDFESNRRFARRLSPDRATSHITTPPLSLPSSFDVERVVSVENAEVIKRQIIEALESGESVFINGKAGSGKTHIVKEFFNGLSEDLKRRMTFLAMNGKAAIDLPEGRTLHSYFGFDRSVYIPSSYLHLPVLYSLANVDRIVVDEIGQVRSDTFTHFVRAVKRAEEYYNKRIQLILLGDFAQIKPVATKQDRELLERYYNGLYAFDSVEWQALNLREFKLRNSERQNNSELVRNLDALRLGDKSAVHYFNQKLDREASNTAIYVCPTNALVNRYNAEKIALFSDKRRFVGTVTGTVDAATLETRVKDLELAVGMRVMAVVNTAAYKNGMIGTVQRINAESVSVLFDGATEPVRVKKYCFLHEGGGTFTQLPLVYAYATTADKCQGMTLEEINIVPGYFAAGQLYTVLSRCKSLEGMHLLGELSEKEVIVDAAALEHCA